MDRQVLHQGRYAQRRGRPTRIVKVKARLNLHGVLNFESAYTVEEIEKEEEVPVTDPAAMDTDGDKDAATQDRGAQGQEAAAQGGPQDCLWLHRGKDASLVAGMKETEGQLYSNDKLVIDTEDRKNALEEMIYDQRSKLDDRYKLFVTSEEKEKYLAALNAQEEWLYSDEGEDAKKSAYVETHRCAAEDRWTHPVPREKEFQERPRPPRCCARRSTSTWRWRRAVTSSTATSRTTTSRR